ncbi:MAG: 4Fe-4S dicluster domain-containing protein [Bacteroidota bacterium]
MIREMVKIDEELCDGCAQCIPNCHEGALQMIDGKARLVSDLMCDGLGACLGHCPQGAITIEKREAEPYNETKVMEIMVTKGENTVVAHLSHLKEHNEMEFLSEGVQYLKDHEDELDFNIREVMSRVHNSHVEQEQLACGCAGSEARSFTPQSSAGQPSAVAAGSLTLGHAGGAEQPSELRQWPVQMHLINPVASYFQQTDVVLAADCVAFSLGNFHSKWLKGKSLAIACPKLDDGHESYISKIKSLIDDAKINTLTVMMMQVPCCGGLIQMAQMAANQAERKIPIKAVIVGVEGEILSEDWV